MLEPVLTISNFLLVKLHLTTSPCSPILKVPVSVVSSYPSGAWVSEILYSPAANSNSFPFFEEINSITFPLSKPERHSIFILAPSRTSPVATSVLVKISFPVVLSFFKLAFIISPPLISKVPTSVESSYPSGCWVSLNSYLPSGKVNLLPAKLEVNSNLTCLFCYSIPTISILAPSIFCPFVTSVLVKSTSPVLTLFSAVTVLVSPSLSITKLKSWSWFIS